MWNFIKMLIEFKLLEWTVKIILALIVGFALVYALQWTTRH